MDILVIDDSNFEKHCLGVQVDGQRVGYGLVPRNYNSHPVGCYDGSTQFDAVPDLPLIDMDEWPERIAEQEANESSLLHIRMRGNGQGGPIPSLDQGNHPYCWAHSATSAALLIRARDNQPYKRLSAFAIACIIKNYRDQGGWGAQALDFIRERGVPTVEFWGEKSTSRANDNASTWENAALHKVIEGWIDLQAAQYDRRLSIQQQGSCLLQNIPLIDDFNNWSHSVCGIKLNDQYKDRSKRDPSRYSKTIWNSWQDLWGTKGMGVMTGSKAWSDGSTAPRTMTLSDK